MEPNQPDIERLRDGKSTWDVLVRAAVAAESPQCSAKTLATLPNG